MYMYNITIYIYNYIIMYGHTPHDLPQLPQT